MSRVLRAARAGDYADVAAFTGDTWSDRDFPDYLPDVFEEWVESDTPDQQTLVAEVDGTVVGLCNAVVLSDWEGWLEGMRVHPDHRGEGHGRALTEAQFDWCHERGCATVRNLVYDWNAAGMGQSRAAGFEPTAVWRWVRPEPDPVPEEDADGLPPGVREDPDGAWSYWSTSPARTELAGLAVDPEESWALSTLTRARLHALADRGRVLVVGEDDTTGMAVRVRTETSEAADDGSPQTVAVYAASAWDDAAAAARLFDAIRADAGSVDADETRVCVPETARHLSDASTVRAPPSDDAMVVHSADVSDR